MGNTSIEWTRSDDGSPGKTWSPADGCSRISEGCLNCYIERQTPFRIAHRKFESTHIGATTGVQLHPNRLTAPLTWRKPHRVFVCSMADLFHDAIPDQYIAQIFAVRALATKQTFQVLTKRHARMRSLLNNDQFIRTVWNECDSLPQRYKHPDALTWPLPNVWAMVTAENQQLADLRIPYLRDTPAAIRGVSAEPLLSPIIMPLKGIDWVIAGGETGPGARPMRPQWVQSLRDQCLEADVAFFFKQWGDFEPVLPDVPDNRCASKDYLVTDTAFVRIADTDGQPPKEPFTTMRRVGKKRAGRVLDRRIWDQFPRTTTAAHE